MASTDDDVATAAAATTTSPSASPNLESALRLPANKRVSTPNAERLSTILEGQVRARGVGGGIGRDLGATPAPPVPGQGTPSRSPWRILSYTASNHTLPSSAPSSIRTAPPAYEWVSNPTEHDNDPRRPVEGEKVAALRRGEVPRRGGFKRLGLIVGVVLLIIIGLAVGLGVGLTVGRRNNSNNTNNTNDSQSSDGGGNNNTTQRFPLGEYSMETNLHAVTTGCISNAATWRCYPYATYDSSDSSTFRASAATFNWIITNTSSTYASNATTANTLDDNGIPANLTISSTNNPFSISFANETLTYHAAADNSSSPYYFFSFIQPKTVIPAVALTADNAASECFFNQTTFAAKLYLAANPNANGGAEDAVVAGGYTPWPFALQIIQSSPSGDDVPNCYVRTADGGIGAKITTGLTPVTTGEECTCQYRNYYMMASFEL